jgi:hypothetical protein
MPTLSGAVSRIFLFLKAVRYGRHEEILPEFLLTVKNLSFAPGGPYRIGYLRVSARDEKKGGVLLGGRFCSNILILQILINTL